MAPSVESDTLVIVSIEKSVENIHIETMFIALRRFESSRTFTSRQGEAKNRQGEAKGNGCADAAADEQAKRTVFFRTPYILGLGLTRMSL